MTEDLLIWKRIFELEKSVEQLLKLQRKQERINDDLIEEYIKTKEKEDETLGI